MNEWKGKLRFQCLVRSTGQGGPAMVIGTVATPVELPAGDYSLTLVLTANYGIGRAIMQEAFVAVPKGMGLEGRDAESILTGATNLSPDAIEDFRRGGVETEEDDR